MITHYVIFTGYGLRIEDFRKSICIPKTSDLNDQRF